MTPAEQKRRDELNDRWTRRYDYSPPLTFSDDDFRERAVLNDKHSRIPTPAPKPPMPQPRPARPAVGAKTFKALGDAATDVIAREITDMRRERELYTAKVDAALARLDAAIARVEAKT